MSHLMSVEEIVAETLEAIEKQGKRNARSKKAALAFIKRLGLPMTEPLEKKKVKRTKPTKRSRRTTSR